MKRVLRFKENDEDTIAILKDMVDVNFEKGKADKVLFFKNKLKSEYNIDYEPMGQYKEIIPSLDTLYAPSDFSSWNEYLQYCDTLFTMRWGKFKSLITSRYDKKTVFFDDMKIALEKSGFELSREENRGSSEIAYVSGKKMTINFAHEEINKNGTIWLGTFIHEMGHIFDNHFKLDYRDDLVSKNMGLASSNYLFKPDEVFAEHFQHYFLQPKYLKAGWEDVYKELDKLITKDWKLLIQSIISVAR